MPSSLRRTSDAAGLSAAVRLALGLCAILGLALCLRLPGLSERALWLDEAYAPHIASLDLATLIDQLRAESTPPLYYLLLKAWIAAWGESEAALRSLSLLFSLGGVGAGFWLGRRFFSPAAGWALALLLAVAPLGVYYAREARMYSLLALCFLLALHGALAFAAGRRGGLWLAAAGNLLALYTHNVALWGVGGVCLAFFLLRPGRRAAMQWLLAQGLVGLLWLPWLFVLLEQVERQATVLAWFVPFFTERGAAGMALDSLLGFALGPYPPWLALPSPADAPYAHLALAAAVGLLGLGLWRARRAGPEPWRRSVFVLAAAALAAGFALAYSVLSQPVFIPGRTDHYLLPAFLLLLALGASSLGRPLVVGLVIGGWAALSLLVLVPYHLGGARAGTAVATEQLWARLRQTVRPQDIVVATGMAGAEVEHHLRKQRSRRDIEIFPASAARHLGYLDLSGLAADAPALAHEASLRAQQWAARLQAGAASDGTAGRLVVLHCPEKALAPFAQAVRARFQVSRLGPPAAQAMTGVPMELWLATPR